MTIIVCKALLAGHKLRKQRYGKYLFDALQPSVLPPPKEGGYVFTSVCSSVCRLDYSKSYERILMKFLEGVGRD